MLVPRETPLEAAIVESQTRDGRSGVQGHRIAIHADRHNETAFMDERKKSFVESQGHGRPG
jgi:hypothetical protein